MRNIKYLVIGNGVIPASTLIRLYNVSPDECILTDKDNVHRVLEEIEVSSRSRLIRLFPRHDGDYKIDHSPMAA